MEGQLRFHNAHTLIVEELAPESLLESVDYSSESADSNADPPIIGVRVWAFRVDFPWIVTLGVNNS